MTDVKIERLDAHRFKVKTGCGNIYVTIALRDNLPVEVFAELGKAGGCAASQNEAIGRLVSLCLRGGIDMDEVIKQLIGISCHKTNEFCRSCSDSVAEACKELKKYLEEPKEENNVQDGRG